MKEQATKLRALVGTASFNADYNADFDRVADDPGVALPPVAAPVDFYAASPVMKRYYETRWYAGKDRNAD